MTGSWPSLAQTMATMSNRCAVAHDPVGLREFEGGEGNPALLGRGDRLGRVACAAGLDLDEDERVAVAAIRSISPRLVR